VESPVFTPTKSIEKDKSKKKKKKRKSLMVKEPIVAAEPISFTKEEL